MFRLLFVFSGALLLGGNVLAADLPSHQVAPVAPTVAPFSWTGFYVGVNAGYAMTHDQTRSDGSYKFREVIAAGELPALFDTSTSGFLGGVQAGFNYQFTPFLVGGIEADYQFADLRGEKEFIRNRTLPPLHGGLPVVTTVKTELHSLGTLRARLGFTPVERVLIYATGGLAFGEVRAENALDRALLPRGGAFTGQNQEFKTGWVVGAGVEWAVLDNVSIRAEYLHYDLGKMVTGSIDRVVRQPHYGLMRTKVEGDLIRVGLNVRF